MAEKIYALIVNNWKSIRDVLLSYILATLINAAPVGDENPWKQFLYNIDPRNSWHLVLMIAAAIVLVIIFMLKIILKRTVRRNSVQYKLSELMNKLSSDELRDVKNCPGYSWGADKALITAPDIFTGWKADDVAIDKVLCGKYNFKYNSELSHEYKKFLESEVCRDIIKKKNNNTRWMMTNAIPNFNKTDHKLFLSVRETDWCTNQFMWTKLRTDKDELRCAIKDAFEGEHELYPNSLCLHLVVVSADNKVIFTKTSSNKRNDYPSKWAVTIGEQLEKEDFTDGGEIADGFVKRWVKRAFKEEFGISEGMYPQLVDEDSISILSIDMESDIYNFSLLTIVKLHESFDSFSEYLNANIVSDKEFVTIKGVKLKDIPGLMRYYSSLSPEEHDLHPSSLFRMFMCFIHFHGISKFIKEYYRHKGKL